jgi:serine/threonine-protein kinase RsbW
MAQRYVSLSIPADPAFARSVRMMASSLAVVCGMSVDDVDDVRMLAEEGFVYSCATGAEACDIRFGLDDAAISIDFSLGPDEADGEDIQYAHLLLMAVCDECDLDEEAATLHTLKRAVV